jgi:hypothetical protein
MNTKHTPGPWRISNGNFANLIEGYSGRHHGEWDDGFRAVASAQHCEPTGNYVNERENAEANARLIAAAPELLEACSLLLEALRSSNVSNGLIRSAEDAARAAIAKARGGA